MFYYKMPRNDDPKLKIKNLILIIIFLSLIFINNYITFQIIV